MPQKAGYAHDLTARSNLYENAHATLNSTEFRKSRQWCFNRKPKSVILRKHSLDATTASYTTHTIWRLPRD